MVTRYAEKLLKETKYEDEDVVFVQVLKDIMYGKLVS